MFRRNLGGPSEEQETFKPMIGGQGGHHFLLPSEGLFLSEEASRVELESEGKKLHGDAFGPNSRKNFLNLL